jgi:predicted RNase H-like HicB family nuclease
VVLLKWKVLLEKDEDGLFTVTVPSLPGCISQGKNRKDALKNIKEAIELHLESLAKEGVPLSADKQIATVAV